jgi:uncharacterized protein YjbI with pentapeptide repeats
MNDEGGAASAAGSPVGSIAAPLRPQDLAGRDLKGWDLTKIEGLLPEHLAGAILTGARLPPEIANFEAVGQVKAISSEARKIFIGLLAACVYCWLVIGTTTDVALILNTASSPLPIINTPIPIAGFYVVGAALLAAVYCYFHFYLQHLWRTLATLPAVFPDGVTLDDKTDPWLLTNLVRTEFPHLRATAPPLARLENLLTIVLAWWLVPLTLVALWARYLPRHDIVWLVWLAILIAGTIFFGVHSFRLARAALRWQVPTASPSEEPATERPQPLLLRILGDARQLRPKEALIGFILPCALLTLLSFSVVTPSLRNTQSAGAVLLNHIGIRTYADLREVEVAERPDGWDREDLSRIRTVDLRGRNLAFADLTRAFLPNADLRGTNLQGASLAGADLRGVILEDNMLLGADLRSVRLEGASLDLRNADLHGSSLSGLWLIGANLVRAQLQGANLVLAQLQGANLVRAQLQGADLWRAQLQGADLGRAQLQGANLCGAQLQGANLEFARLQGADLRGAGLWRALFHPDPALWDLADLRRAHLFGPMADAEIDALITWATPGIPNEGRRGRVVESLTAALRTDDRPARPDFPDTWGSEPNVMFERTDPEPEPLDWGPRKWESPEDYDRDLANFLGDLACGDRVPEAQTKGLVRRALSSLLPSRRIDDPNRQWGRFFAARVLGPDCPPAEGLPQDMRRQLERLAAEFKEEPVVDAATEAVPVDPVE